MVNDNLGYSTIRQEQICVSTPWRLITSKRSKVLSEFFFLAAISTLFVILLRHDIGLHVVDVRSGGRTLRHNQIFSDA